MLKLLLLLLGAWVVLIIFKQRRRPHPPETSSGNMVRCAVCSVHLPESESIASGRQHYCSEAHFLQRKKE